MCTTYYHSYCLLDGFCPRLLRGQFVLRMLWMWQIGRACRGLADGAAMIRTGMTTKRNGYFFLLYLEPFKEPLTSRHFFNITWCHRQRVCSPKVEFFPWVLVFFLEFWVFSLCFNFLPQYSSSFFKNLLLIFHFFLQIYKIWNFLLI